MTTTIHTAKSAARKLIKKQVYIRQSLAETSRAEEKGTEGAKAARETLTANLQRDINAADKAISDTEKAADSIDRLSMGLGPKYHAMTLLGTQPSRLNGIKDLAKHVADRLRTAADTAQDRLDAANSDIRSTATLALFLARLPGVKFDRSHASLKDLRTELHRAQTASKKAKRQ